MHTCRSLASVLLPDPLCQVITPLLWQQWDRALEAHPDQRLRHYIVEGIKDGFRIGFDGSRAVVRPAMYTNMPSTQEHPEVVDSYLAEECGEGRVVGPLRPEWVPGIHCSRFGVIPKATSGKWRLITDLSFPHGEAVNDGVGEVVSSLTCWSAGCSKSHSAAGYGHSLGKSRHQICLS